VQLLKRKSDCEETFRLIAGKSSREAVTTKRSDLCGVVIKSRFHRIKRRRMPMGQQGRATRAQVISEGYPGTRKAAIRAELRTPRAGNDGRSSEHHKVVVQPEQRAQQRPRVGPHGETRQPLVLGVGAHHIQLHQSLTDAIVNTVERNQVETLRQARK
jgi:hypothetical protein